MDYCQHRNHMADGTAPVDGCYWCYRFIVKPAWYEKHGGRANGSHVIRHTVSLDEFDELAAQEAA